MPLRLPDKLPAIDLLKKENIFVMDETRAHSQQIRPLRIVILNLMPMKVTTETDLIRLLSNTPLQMEIYFMKLKSHTSKNTPVEHMMMFYRDSEELMKQKFDGMIVTGAPVETIPYENVDYWKEFNQIVDWARHNVQSTLYLCWGAMAALYHFYGIPKYQLPMKKFGIFKTYPADEQLPIFRGFDDLFYMPHSRHTEVRQADIEKVPELNIIAKSPEAGVSIVSSRHGRDFYILGHLEYAPNTLDNEYHRDLGKRDDVALPQHYYRDDDPEQGYKVRWRSAANLFYSNWIDYYVYQETPFNISDIK